MMWGWGNWSGMGWGWMLIGGLLTVLFWVAVIWLIVWGIRRFSGGGPMSGPSGKSALDIAKERYARGEITKEQFEQIKKDLT